MGQVQTLPGAGGWGELLPLVPPALKPHRCPHGVTVALGGTGAVAMRDTQELCRYCCLLTEPVETWLCASGWLCWGVAASQPLSCGAVPLGTLPAAVVSRGVQGPCWAPRAAVVPALPVLPRGTIGSFIPSHPGGLCGK